MQVVVTLLLFTLLGIAWLLHTARAARIEIPNANFESPAIAGMGASPDNWTAISGGGSVGNVNDSPQGFWTTPAPSGKQALAVITSPSGPSAVFSQVLTATVQPNTSYSLMGYVGSIELGSPDYVVTVFANGVPLGSNGGQAPFGSFAPFTLTFDSRVGNALNQISQPLEIQLRSLFRYAVFDDLRLDGTLVPEPHPLSLAAMAIAAMLGRANGARKAIR